MLLNPYSSNFSLFRVLINNNNDISMLSTLSTTGSSVSTSCPVFKNAIITSQVIDNIGSKSLIFVPLNSN